MTIWIVLGWAIVATFFAIRFSLKIYLGAPFPDTGFFIFRVADARVHRVLDKVLIANGFRAVKTINSGGIFRTAYANGLVVCHVDLNAPQDAQTLPTAAIAVPVRTPLFALVSARGDFLKIGYTTLSRQVDSTIPIDLMAGLFSDRSKQVQAPYEWGSSSGFPCGRWLGKHRARWSHIGRRNISNRKGAATLSRPSNVFHSFVHHNILTFSRM